MVNKSPDLPCTPTEVCQVSQGKVLEFQLIQWFPFGQEVARSTLYTQMSKSLVVQTAQVLTMPSIRHKSPAKRIRDMRRLLTFMLAKIEHQEFVPSRTSQKQDDEPICLQSGVKPFTLADFLSVRNDNKNCFVIKVLHINRKKKLLFFSKTSDKFF